MKPLPIILLVGTGGLLLWLVLDPKSMSTSARKGRKKIEESTRRRLPRPDVEVEVPESEEDYVLLSDAIDEQIGAVCRSGRPSDISLFAAEVTRRVLADLYPEFPWPAQTGDHSSALEIQGLIYHTVRNSDLATICDAIDQPEALDEEPEELPEM